MANETQTSLVRIMSGTPAPELQQLKQRIIDAGGKLTKDSIKDDAITDLFTPLLGTGEIALQNTLYDFPDDTTLAITATATLFKKPQIELNIQFTLSGKQLLLTINSNPDALAFTLTEMAEGGLLPPSISFTPQQWPTIQVDNVQIIFDSAVQTFSVTNGSNNEWDILGYTNGITIKNPHLTVTKQLSDTVSNFTITAGGELKSPSWDNGIAIEIGLPVGLLGWSVSIAKPVSLDAAVGILSALVGLPGDGILSILPEQIRSVIENIEIAGLSIRFNPFSPATLYSINLLLNTKKEWVIIQDLLQLKSIRIMLQAQRYNTGDDLSVTGSLIGVAELNYSNEEDKLTIQSSIPFPAFDGNVWEISIGNGDDKVHFGKLAALIPGLKQVLPDKFYDVLSQIILDNFTIRFHFKDGFQIDSIAFGISSDASWQLPMLEEVVQLEQIKLSIVAENKEDGMTVTKGHISGTIQIAGGEVSIPIRLDKNEGTDNNWELNVTSDYIPLPSIDTLAPFMGRGIISGSTPVGLLDLGEFALYNIALKWRFGTGGGLQLFAFTVQSTPDTIAWNLVPGYFVLSELYVSLKIENLSPLERDVSGAIGCMVVISIDEMPEHDLQLAMLAEKPSSNDPWKFSGSLESEVNLRILLNKGLHVPEQITMLVPDLTVVQLDLAIEPNSGSFFLNTACKGGTDGQWVIITDLLVLNNLSFQIDRSPDGTELEAAGNFDFFENFKADVTAKYSSKNSSWNFIGSVNNPGGISINKMLEKYIKGINESSIPKLTIDYIKLQFTKVDNKAANENYTTYDFSIAGSLTIPLGDNIVLSALLNVLYDSRKTSVYDGTKIQGELDFGGMNFKVIATYANNQFSTYKFEFNFGRFTIIAEVEIDLNGIAIFRFGFTSEQKITLGSMISAMVEAATGEQPSIPSPWDFINNIVLSDFKLVFKYNTKTKKAVSVGLAYNPSINLGFIDIKEISLLYTLGDNRSIKFEVTKGTFLGQEIQPADKPGVDVLDPKSATPVPGFGESLFKLETLSLGNQVEVVKQDPKALTSVATAIAYLDAAFDQPDDGKKIPTTLKYNKDYGWLISAQFVLVEYISVGLIFYDPVIYGVQLGVSGGKFNGLKFQILYKKVNNNIGVYQIDLTLPDFVRKQQFGAVAVTLPSITLLIYTNGDFKIDMGFPYAGDFSRSFGLEMTIFTGSGGFYFAKLSNATAGDYKVPVSDKGEFNPVIAFGIGIKAGIGKSIDKGILKAELSLTIQAILEGVLAWYKPYPNNMLPVVQGGNEVLYYRIQAQVALVGRIYGEINFAIISASLDIIARIAVQLVIEAYKDIELRFTAEVSASVTVKINLGLFSISISCSFSASITENFTITQPHNAPWLLSEPQRSAAYFYSLDKKRIIDIVPDMDWNAPINYPKKSIDLIFLPQLSIAYKAGAPNNRNAVGVAMLYVQSDEVGAPAVTESNFSTLAQAAFAWVLNAYFKGDGNILEKPITIDDLQKITDYFNQEKFTKDLEEPFTKDQLLEHFFAGCFDKVLIRTETAAPPAAEKYVGIFPVLPVLEMELPNKTTLDFEEHYLCTAAYLEEIKKYFREMQVQYQDRQEQFMSEERLNDIIEQSLAEYLFKDYFVMLAKYAIQAGMDELKQTTYVVKEDQSLQDIVDEMSHYQVNTAELAFANRHVPTRENNTLRSLAEQSGITVKELVQVNATTPGIFSPGTTLIIPFVASMTVEELINKLQAAQKFDNLSGMLSRFYLSGLRIPDKTATDRIALYEASGQQFAVDTVVATDTVSLYPNKAYKDKLNWLQFEDALERKVSFNFDQAILDKVTLLNNSSYLPTIDLTPQAAVLRYKIEAKTLTLPTQLSWQNPDLPNNNEQKDCYIWTFPDKLRQLLADKPNLPAMLEYQASNSAFSVEDPAPVTPLYWATSIEVQLSRITTGSGVEEMIVDVQGCSESDARLISLLLTQQTAQPDQLMILFDRDKTAPNDGEQVKGLQSEAIKDISCFLLQTNYSHASNPPAGSQSTGMEVNNIVGMDVITFLTYLWECSIVRSGGYYLYYKNTSTNKGLPEYLFDEKGNGAITLVISYKIPAENGDNNQQYYKLPPYVNSVVITKEIHAGEDNLYVTPYLTDAQKKEFNPSLQEKHATLLTGNGMFQGTRPNPGTQSIATVEDAVQQQINELYNLLEYRVEAEAAVYVQSNYALPAGPLTQHEKKGFSISDAITIPSKEDDWTYESALPLFPFVVNNEAKDPYAAINKQATVGFNFLDIFGNYLSKGGFTQPILPGYIDVIIPPDQWLNVSKHYAVHLIDKAPKLVSTFGFDTNNYFGKIEEATRDLKVYKNIRWQLQRTDVAITLSNTLDGSTAVVKTEIATFIDDIIAALELIIAGNPGPIIVEKTITTSINVATVNADMIFNLQVAVEIERTDVNLIDPQFRDIAEVQFGSSDLVPDFSSKTDESAIYEFATALEEALPFLKVSLGTSKAPKKKIATLQSEIQTGAATNDNAKEVWLVRWADGSAQKGIAFTVEQPYYFAVKPLSTTLISRPDEQVQRPVPIRTYKSGEYIGNATSDEKVYAGTDIETLAGKFITTLDNFFLAKPGTDAWLLQSAHPANCDNNPDPSLCPFEVIEKAKKDIAAAIADKQLTNVLMPAPDKDSLTNAQKNLQEQLLIQLGNANSVHSVVQSKVKIEKGNTYPAALYGNLTNADNADKFAYKFSPVKVSLDKETSQLGSFFSSNSEGAPTLSDAASQFDASLDLHITALEHDYQPPINGYIASSWLSFVNPIIVKRQNAHLIDAQVPLPLKAYPTAASLSAQNGVSSIKEDATDPTITEMKQWDYRYTYDYAAAVQDTIVMNVKFNTTQKPFGKKAMEDEPDLFESLAQFNLSCDEIMNDLLNNNNAWTALQSFAWITQKVANAWPLWTPPSKPTGAPVENEVNFSLTELKGDGDNENLLLVAIDDISGMPLAYFPKPEIEGFETVVVSATAEKSIFKFKAVRNGEEAYLPFDSRGNYLARRIVLEKLDILDLENAWAGVSIHRNEHLINDTETNPDFVYKTPYVRFANACIPAISNRTPIDISVYTRIVIGEQQHLSVYLVNFFKAFFNNATVPANTIQLECSYSYSLQSEGVNDGIDFQPRLPVLLTIPAKYASDLPDKIQQFVYRWFKDNDPKGVAESGQLNFVLSVYSTAEETGGKAPILKLGGLYLPTNLLLVD